MENETAATKNSAPASLVCLLCEKSRFPEPQEQCYKFGGLICTVDDSNVEKYQPCKFALGTGKLRQPSAEK